MYPGVAQSDGLFVNVRNVILYSMHPKFIDVEASALDGFPIQIAYGSGEGEITSHLIRPFDSWLKEKGRWSPQAFKLHGLSIDFLLEAGSDPHEVAFRIEEDLWGQTVYSDATDYDHTWINILFNKVSTESGTHLVMPCIREMGEILPASCSPRERQIVRDRIRLQAEKEGLRIHHADADVLVHIRTLREIQKL
ncbi:hypothetical protein [Alcanivorax sp.]|jgi:hypothetical protein|uniref:hypothetical protein n=1 Tax=Alcanivorax sp. TaxID=1872427 RepID=UPI0032D99C9A